MVQPNTLKITLPSKMPHKYTLKNKDFIKHYAYITIFLQFKNKSSSPLEMNIDEHLKICNEDTKSYEHIITMNIVKV